MSELSAKEWWVCRYCDAHFKDMEKHKCRACGGEHVLCKPCRRKQAVPVGEFPRYEIRLKTCPTLPVGGTWVCG